MKHNLPKPLATLFAAFAGLLAAPGTALAQNAYAPAGDSGDTASIILASALVLFMILPGFALFHAGRLPRRDGHGLMVQTGAVLALVSVIWIMVGYTLAFGMVTAGWLGAGNAWMLIDLGAVRYGLTIPESGFVLFQMILALIPPALMIGAWAGRARFSWVMAFCALWCLMVYAPIAHWVWGGGWLATRFGALDFAGGLVVHATAGTSALIVALLLGPRTHSHTGSSDSAPMVATAGAMVLWAGWLALAGGSAFVATDDASSAIINTHAAASAGALAWLTMAHLRRDADGAGGFASGALAGLVTISPAALVVSPGGAIVIGIAGAMVCRATIRLIRHRMGMDDPLNIFAVHGACGVAGALLLAIFIHPRFGGIGYDPGMQFASQMLAQATAAGVIVLWAAIVSAVLALAISLVFPMHAQQAQDANKADCP